MTINLSPRELAVASQSQLDGFKDPNKRAMLGAMGVNVGNVQQAEGIKSLLQSAIAGQGAQQAAPGGSIVDRMAMAVKAKVDQQKQQEEMMKVAMGFRGMESAENGVGSLPVPDQEYAEGGIVPFAKGGQPKVAVKEEPAAKEDWLSALRREAAEERKQRMSAIPEIERPNETKLREDYTNRDIAVSQPYVDKMDALIKEALPNTEGIRNQNRSNSIITAGLQMLQARGGPGFAGGLAGIAGGAQRGLNQYQEGEQALQNQLQKHQGFRMESIKNELGMRRDRMRYAEDAVRNAEREYGIDSRERKAAVAAAERAEAEYLRAGIAARNADIKEAAAIRRDDLQSQRLNATLARIGSGGGGGGGRSASDKQDQRYDAAIQAALKDKTILAPFMAQYKGQPDAYFKALNDYARYVEVSIGGKSAAPSSAAPTAAPSNQRVIPYKP